jgi:hypothetical protein
MRTLAAHRPTTETVVAPAPSRAKTEPAEVFEDFDTYVPASQGAPRPARRIAMEARREQDRRRGGW